MSILGYTKAGVDALVANLNSAIAGLMPNTKAAVVATGVLATDLGGTTAAAAHADAAAQIAAVTIATDNGDGTFTMQAMG